MSAPTNPPEIPAPQRAPTGQWAFPTDEKGEPKKKFVLWIVFGAVGCFVAVVALIIVAAVAIPSFVLRFQREKIQHDVNLLASMLQTYASTNGERFPDTLEAIFRPDPKGHRLTFDIKDLPRDPWGHAYHYEPPPIGQSWPDVYSLGRDGLPGGKGADEDVHSLRLPPGNR